MADQNQEIVALRDQLSTVSSQVTTLMADLAASTKNSKDLETMLLSERAERQVDDLIRAGKLFPKQRDWAKGYALSNPEGFKQFADGLTPLLELTKEHGSEKNTEAGEKNKEQGDPALELSEKVSAYMASNAGTKYGEALRAVTNQHPELAARYREAMNGVSVQ